MEFITVGALESPLRPLEPFRIVGSILTDNPQFPVQNADSVLDRDDVTCGRIVTRHNIRGLAAGYLKPLGVHISLPRELSVKGDRRGACDPACAGFRVEYIGSAKPLLVAVVVHFVDYPRRGKHLGFLPCAGKLLLRRLFHTGLDFDFHIAQQLVYGDLRRFREIGTVFQVGVRGKDNVLLCGFILKQAVEDRRNRIGLKINQFTHCRFLLSSFFISVSGAAAVCVALTQCFQRDIMPLCRGMKTPAFSR